VVLSGAASRAVTGLVLAAGSGERLHGESKAFLAWRGEPLLLHAARMLSRSCTRLRIGIRTDERERAAAALERGRVDVPYELVAGGAVRRETLLKLVQGVAAEWVMLHDVARPFAGPALFEQVLAAAFEHGAASAAENLRERDGVAEHGEGFIERTVPYARLTYLQTPQACRTGVLRDALEDPQLAGEHSVCGLLRARGHRVRLVCGEAGNVKITYPEDLQLLRWRVG
jgi:2-C-methyl-D-erythritol 4-phosphate cytidylyltransferase